MKQVRGQIYQQQGGRRELISTGITLELSAMASVAPREQDQVELDGTPWKAVDTGQAITSKETKKRSYQVVGY